MEVACADPDTKHVAIRVPARAVATLSRIVIGLHSLKEVGHDPPEPRARWQGLCAKLPQPYMNRKAQKRERASSSRHR
jgi:hypothetical protein